eukprot:4256670-Alexandrium_andersonii.AAC.1
MLFWFPEGKILIDLHVGDGHGTGQTEQVRKLLDYLGNHLEMKVSELAGVGDSYTFLRALK